VPPQRMHSASPEDAQCLLCVVIALITGAEGFGFKTKLVHQKFPKTAVSGYVILFSAGEDERWVRKRSGAPPQLHRFLVQLDSLTVTPAMTLNFTFIVIPTILPYTTEHSQCV